MTLRNMVCLVAFFLVAGLLYGGCWKSETSAAQDAGMGSDAAAQGDGDADSDGDSDGDADSDSDGDSDGDADSDSDSDSDSDTDLVQGPIAFVVHNTTSSPKYIQGWYHFQFEKQEGSTWESCLMEEPFCSFMCGDVDKGSNCCIDCDYMPAMQLIEPGGKVEWLWNASVYKADFSHCSDCECYRPEAAPAGQYRISVHVWDSFSCVFTECTTQEGGLIEGAEPAGESVQYVNEFEIVYEEDSIDFFV